MEKSLALAFAPWFGAVGQPSLVSWGLSSFDFQPLESSCAFVILKAPLLRTLFSFNYHLQVCHISPFLSIMK